jgi:hypothetical protein
MPQGVCAFAGETRTVSTDGAVQVSWLALRQTLLSPESVAFALDEHRLDVARDSSTGGARSAARAK